MRVVPIPQLQDNYAYLAIDPATGSAGVVDVADAAPVLDAARRERVEIVAILSTHHHLDHVGGNEDLIRGCAPRVLRVYGYAGDRERIPGITDGLEHGQSFALGRLRADAIFIPAHTRGHLAYYFPEESLVFTGDTLFAGGCGRLFEGDAAQMKGSLDRLAKLPDDTRVYCGHEYTQNNLRFAATLEPSNRALQRRRQEVDQLRQGGQPTVPTTIAIEKATNPFLRSQSRELRESLRTRFPDLGEDEVAVFAATRRLKDTF